MAPPSRPYIRIVRSSCCSPSSTDSAAYSRASRRFPASVSMSASNPSIDVRSRSSPRSTASCSTSRQSSRERSYWPTRRRTLASVALGPPSLVIDVAAESALDLDGPLELVQAGGPAGDEVVECDAGGCRRERRLVPERLGDRERGAPVLGGQLGLARADVKLHRGSSGCESRAPGSAAPARVRRRRSRVPAASSFRRRAPARAGPPPAPHRARENWSEPVEQAAGALGVARREVEACSLQASTPPRGAVADRRDRRRLLQQPAGGVERAARLRGRGGRLQLRCDGGAGTGGGKREMRRPFLRAVERSCERRVRGATTSRRGGLVDRRGDEWMGEADSLAVDDHDPGCRRLHERSFETLLPVRREQDVDRGAGEGRRAEEDIACAGAELRDTPADCVGGGGWDRNQRGRVVGEPVLGEQCRDFLAEQRIPVARRVELPKNRPGKSIAATHDGLERLPRRAGRPRRR